MKPPTWQGRYYKGAMKHRREQKRIEAVERQEAEQLRAAIRLRERVRELALTIASSR